MSSKCINLKQNKEELVQPALRRPGGKTGEYVCTCAHETGAAAITVMDRGSRGKRKRQDRVWWKLRYRGPDGKGVSWLLSVCGRRDGGAIGRDNVADEKLDVCFCDSGALQVALASFQNR